MNFFISDTFTQSLGKLTNDEQKAAKITAYDIHTNPESPGLKLHKIDQSKDKNFWSARVNEEIRIILHKAGGNCVICYIDHHNKAYSWAKNHKLENHPKTGAAQLVEYQEIVQEVLVPVHVPVAHKKKQPLLNKTDDDLLLYGIPSNWLNSVRQADEDSILEIADHLPAEAAEALLDLFAGGKPKLQAATPTTDPFQHPDAKRRFRKMADARELESALAFPWEKWTVFLHPDQRQWVDRDESGPARVSGSAGTGKTIVALHRAVRLARDNPDHRILLATFTDALANALLAKLKQLVVDEPLLMERIDVHSLRSLGLRLYKIHFGAAKLASDADIQALINEASKAETGHKFSLTFLISEWEQVVDTWQLDSWDAYRTVPRLGRRIRLPEAQRKTLWAIFERVRAGLFAQGLTTESAVFTALAAKFDAGHHPPFDFAIVDEAQDLSVAQLRFFAAMGKDRANALFFAGDIGQRIFQQPFSWKALGVNIQGRARTLRINYRTSHQIRQQADKLIGTEVSDADGNTEKRNDARSVFNGPPPSVRTFSTEAEEITAIGAWITTRHKTGIVPHAFGVFVRSEKELSRAESAVKAANLPYKILDTHMETTSGHVSICTMHLAKGLEFRAVVVMACDAEIIPSKERLTLTGDESDFLDAFNTERHLLYVACTRARDDLFITGVEPASEFLDDLRLEA